MADDVFKGKKTNRRVTLSQKDLEYRQKKIQEIWQKREIIKNKDNRRNCRE